MWPVATRDVAFARILAPLTKQFVTLISCCCGWPLDGVGPCHKYCAYATAPMLPISDANWFVNELWQGNRSPISELDRIGGYFLRFSPKLIIQNISLF